MLEYKQSRIVSEKICTNAIFLAPILVWGFRNFSKSNKFYKKKLLFVLYVSIEMKIWSHLWNNFSNTVEWK